MSKLKAYALFLAGVALLVWASGYGVGIWRMVAAGVLDTTAYAFYEGVIIAKTAKGIFFVALAALAFWAGRRRLRAEAQQAVPGSTPPLRGGAP